MQTKVYCKICNRGFSRITATHLKSHNMTVGEYREKFGFGPEVLSSDDFRKKMNIASKEHWMEKYGDCWKLKYDEYCSRQSYTNSYEYFKTTRGWTEQEFKDYNLSRGSRGEFNPMFGTSYYDIWVKKYGKCEADRLNEQASVLKAIGSRARKGRKKSESARRNMSKSAIERIREQGTFISFNPHACDYIERYGKDNGYNFIHALNGGEYLVENVWYYVDGYDVDKNVVIEYYEPHHKYKIEEDDIRIGRIISELKCSVIIAREDKNGSIAIENIEYSGN